MNPMNSQFNPITLIDGYKFSHRQQYPAGTTRVYSNWTPRESRIPGIEEVVFFGLQYFLDNYLDARLGIFRNFFQETETIVCEDYARRTKGYLGPNSIGVEHIRELHQLGYIPLEFRAVPEGTRVPIRVPMLTVENTHPDFFWLVNYFETLLSNVLWLPCTSATNAYRMRRLLNSAARATGSPLDFVPWQGHDFSFRGMAGPEAAMLSAVGHLLSFTGTDTVPALDLVENYYGPLPPDYLIGGSVAATEHSVMSAGGELDELATFERLLDLYPSGIVSIVSDTWDLWNVLTTILPQLKDRIMARDGKIVIRPDSGNPADIICGDPNTEPGSPVYKGVIELLWDLFGGTQTPIGYRLLDSHIGCIYGDSITYERAREITDRLASKGFASGNIVFGIGSFSYQFVTRDTFGFAMKATWCQVAEQGRDIFKKPKTDSGSKNSAKGRLAVLPDPFGTLRLISQATPEQEGRSVLKSVWLNGNFLVRENFATIRERLESTWDD
jgi:nicotinamide phosphoribosyltransferase